MRLEAEEEELKAAVEDVLCGRLSGVDARRQEEDGLRRGERARATAALGVRPRQPRLGELRQFWVVSVEDAVGAADGDEVDPSAVERAREEFAVVVDAGDRATAAAH